VCGIAGTWGADAPHIVTAMMDRLAHRGPDAEGLFSVPGRVGTLGHRRLSIVDVEGGDQPLITGNRVLIANGEIYNAPALRGQLEDDRDFATRSDSEVILHLLYDADLSAAARLDGMFAFALVRDGELVLGRDPIGIKPLYTGRKGRSVVFSSELRAFPRGTRSIQPFPPGTVWSSRTGIHERYYDVPDPDPVEGPLAAQARRVRAALEAAVVRQLMSDVPVGAFLSGGLDSSALVALMRPHVDRLHTFSVGLPGSPDLAAARLVADHLDTTHHEYLLDPREIRAALPEIVAALESFDQDLVRSAVPTWFTARLAAEHVKVVLTGEGADELFAGYRYHKALDSDALQDDARRSLAALHHVNLQRVDRLTMAHSLEARVPYLDLDMIETALSIPAGLRRPGEGAPEKAVLRMAVDDLLPASVVWRDKAQFDEGSGAADLLPDLAAGDRIDVEAYRAGFPGTPLRSAEECLYHRLLRASLPQPEPVLANVARWTDRGQQLTADG
jgi:asparagine synthase (glutamine-hydrolysing)